MTIRVSLAAHPDRHALATPTGLEPAASAVTGRRANQLRYGARCSLRSGGTLTHGQRLSPIGVEVGPGRTPNRIRTGATAVKGRGPGPLDDGGPLAPDEPARASPSIEPAAARFPTRTPAERRREADEPQVGRKLAETCQHVTPTLTSLAS